MTAMEAVLSMVSAGVLEVRSDGTVWKLRNLNRMPLNAPRRVETRGKNGYLLVKVCVRGKQFMVGAHQLVWTVLRGPIPEGLEPNHEDGNKENNDPANLKLMTRSKNIQHAWDTGLRWRSNMPLQMATRVKALRARGESYSRIATLLGISQTTAFRAAQLS